MWDAATDEDGRVYAVGGTPVKDFDARAGRGRDGAVEVARGSARFVLVTGISFVDVDVDVQHGIDVAMEHPALEATDGSSARGH